jgi:hypothetical protein
MQPDTHTMSASISLFQFHHQHISLSESIFRTNRNPSTTRQKRIIFISFNLNEKIWIKIVIKK